MLSPADAQLAGRDSALPGLATVLDPEAVLDRIRSGPILGARAVHVRYKPGTSCVVGYRLDKPEGPEFVYAKAYRPRDRSKLEKARSKAQGAVETLEREAVVVAAASGDRDLPALALLVDPLERTALLQRLLPGLPEAWAGELRALRYKPERRWVGVVEVEGRPVALLKVYRPEDVQRARAGQKALAGPNVPPLGWWARRGILASTWVPGISLAHAISRDQCCDIEAIGAALADIHRLSGRGLERLSTDNSIEAVRAGAAAVEALLPALGWRAQLVADAFAQGLVGAPGPAAVIHGDFSADQVVLAADGPVVIDFDQACVGDPAADVGSFAADLEWAELEGRIRPGRAGEITDALIRGYRRSGGGAVAPGHLEFQRSAALLRLAVAPFRERRPGWPGTVEALLCKAEAAACLARAKTPGALPEPRSADALEALLDAEHPEGGRPKTRRAGRQSSGSDSSEDVLEALLDIDDPAGGGRLKLRRAWPRNAGHLLLEYLSGDTFIAGQWFADQEKGMEVAAATPGATWAPGHGVVLQPCGADRRLKDLAGLAARRDATLVVHRPERRAVLRLDRTPTRYLKLVRPAKANGMILRHRVAFTSGLAIPDLIQVDPETGFIVMSELPGTSLHKMLRNAPLPALIEGAAAAGRALRKLHSTPIPPGIPEFRGADELAATARWVDLAAAYGVAVPGAAALMDHLKDLLRGHPGPACLVHRDLHDKQILVNDRRAGLLDLDTLAAGEAALDLANLLVHFELRAGFGVSQERSREAARALLDAYDPPEAVMSRVHAYAASTRLRLACVYGFRPARPKMSVRTRHAGFPFESSL